MRAPQAAPSRAPSSAPRGFTLIELTIALLILTVMAAVAAPALLNRRPPPAMEEAQGRLEALFRMARDSAVRSATPVTVVVDSASGLVWFDARTRLAAEVAPPTDDRTDMNRLNLRLGSSSAGAAGLGIGLSEPGAVSRAPANGESLELPTAVRMQLFQARTQFTFSPNGAALGDSIQLSAATGEVHMITVDPWNGRARIR